jgi:DNA-directed RNA polymerase specialized sigma24 family protein
MVMMFQSSEAYDPSVREELDKVDWDVVIPKVFKYAFWRAKKFAWLGEEADPEALVHEAIARAYGVGIGGTYRNWNRGKCPDIVDFLNGIIRSMTSHGAEHSADFPVESLHAEDGSPKDNKLFKSADSPAGALRPKTPEDELVEAENLQALMDLLDELADTDEDLGMVILAIKDEIGKPREIARETGFEVGKVNNVLKRLRRKLRHLKPKTK